MKNLNYLKVVSTLIVLFFIASSCNTTKKMALPCPEPPSHYKSKTSLNHPRRIAKLYAIPQKDTKRRYSYSNKQHSNPASTQSESVSSTNKIEYKTNLYAGLDNSAVPVERTYSPTIIINDEVADFRNNEGIYKRVGLIPINSNPNPEINYLKYSGEILKYATKPIVTIPQGEAIKTQKTHWMAFTVFITFLVGGVLSLIHPFPYVFIIVPLCGLIGLVLSIIALKMIKKNPEKYKGKGLAIAGLIISILAFVLGGLYLMILIAIG
jgi:hypothetical protein